MLGGDRVGQAVRIALREPGDATLEKRLGELDRGVLKTYVGIASVKAPR